MVCWNKSWVRRWGTCWAVKPYLGLEKQYIIFLSGLLYKTGLFCMLFSLQKQSTGFILLSITTQVTKGYCMLHLNSKHSPRYFGVKQDTDAWLYNSPGYNYLSCTYDNDIFRTSWYGYYLYFLHTASLITQFTLQILWACMYHIMSTL